MKPNSFAAALGAATVASLAALAAPAAASATVLLSDNFNSDTQALNWPGDATFMSEPTPAMIGKSSTDLIGNNGAFPFCSPGATNQCVDMDGSTGDGNRPAGKLISTSKFAPGTYTVSFQLGGNQRGAPAQTTKVKLGSFSQLITLASDAPWTTYTFTFSDTKTGRLKFIEQGPSDQQGNILDNVVLSSGAAPEPATWALMILGAGAVGAMGRRSRRLRAIATA